MSASQRKKRRHLTLTLDMTKGGQLCNALGHVAEYAKPREVNKASYPGLLIILASDSAPVDITKSVRLLQLRSDWTA